ncbi:MAG: RNA polymerase factor sigma-54 [Saprospiraceae bacterium]|nr:RNA polymerase factor sigma-54 [Saprospiraceae bacterium]
MLKQSLSQKLLQKLSPQQIQLMKLLQVPTANLEQRIKEELETNPALEEGDEGFEMSENDELYFSGTTAPDESAPREEYSEGEHNEDYVADEVGFEDYYSNYMDDEDPSYKYNSDNYTGEDEDKSIPIAVEDSFHEYLEQQLGMLDLKDEREFAIARQIIGSIDDDGYLRREPISITDDLIFTQNIVATEVEVLNLLKRIQKFDPPGIGARDLQECLLLQLQNRLNAADLHPLEREPVLVAIKIIDHYFDEFSKKHFPKLQRQLNISDEGLKEAVDVILKLNPKPASGHVSGNGSGMNFIVVPDFIISNRDGELELTLNSKNAPDLRINDHYKDMIRTYKQNKEVGKASRQDRDTILFIKQKIDSAKWFIDAIKQRQETMYGTMYCIMEYQYDYFLTGDSQKMKPMILKDIADRTGLDISTVSRVANSKFVQTEFGTKRLKEFFSESLTTEDGDEVSTLEVKKILTDIIKEESKKKPHSDEKLKSMLQKKGYNIARRTVAKYREQLNIPVARLRKEL